MSSFFFQRRRFWQIIVLACGLHLAACASYQSKVKSAKNLIIKEKLEEAAEKLAPLANTKSDDQLPYLLELATVRHIQGEYKQSNELFLQADRLVEEMDYTSISNVALATAGSEGMIQYKGESFEKVLIHIYMALNFLMLKDTDNAQVAIRRANDLIQKFRQDGRENYELNPFAHYLSALIWESEGNFDNAYIAISKAYEIDGTNPFFPEDLIRLARKARRPEEEKKWREHFQMQTAASNSDRSLGELVVIFQQGWGPRKGYSQASYRFPKLYHSPSIVQNVLAKVEPLNSDPSAARSEVSKMIYNLEAVSIKTLDDDYGAMIARRVGAIVAKEVIADQIRQKNEIAGFLAWIVMHFSDQADLRQWSFLPQTFQMVRFQLKAGKYRLALDGVDANSTVVESKPAFEFEVFANKKTFVTWRSVQ